MLQNGARNVETDSANVLCNSLKTSLVCSAISFSSAFTCFLASLIALLLAFNSLFNAFALALDAFVFDFCAFFNCFCNFVLSFCKEDNSFLWVFRLAENLEEHQKTLAELETTQKEILDEIAKYSDKNTLAARKRVKELNKQLSEVESSIEEAKSNIEQAENDMASHSQVTVDSILENMHLSASYKSVFDSNFLNKSIPDSRLTLSGSRNVETDSANVLCNVVDVRRNC